jgi:hypothetical protein
MATIQIEQTIENSLFNILDLLRFCDKRDMAKDLTCKIWIWDTTHLTQITQL